MNNIFDFDFTNLKLQYVPESIKKISFYHSDEINWLKVSILTLIGLGVYNLTIANILNVDYINHHNLKLAINDIIKFGSMFVILRFLSGEPLNDYNWIIEVFYVLVGFMTYDFIVIDFINTNELKNNNKICRETKMAIDDVTKFLTMFVISRWLSGKKFTKEWILNVVGFLVGLVAYDYLISEFI